MGLNSTPRTWVAGEVVTAAEFNAEVRDAFNGLQAAWTAYTPALTATTTNPTLGTGNTKFGSFLQMGNTIFCIGQIYVGTTGFNAGSGTYKFSLPVAANIAGATSKRVGILTAAGSGGAGGFAYLNDANNISMFYYNPPPDSGHSLSHSIPGAQVAGSVYDWCVTYEAA